jgi:hypothetical protein
MCTQYLYHIHPLTPFSHIIPSSTDINYPDRTCSAFLLSDFGKKMAFLFVWDSCRWIFLVKFPYICAL